MATRDIDREYNAHLDRAIEERRTVRQFEEEEPPREYIEEIIKAGLLAPYAAVAVGAERVFRRFMVMGKDSQAKAAIARLMRDRIVASAQQLKQAMEDNPFLRDNAGAFVERLETIANGGEIGFESVPYFIVVAEKKGFPPAESRSLAHCLENMWLKATALGLGFRLISAAAQMADDPEFCSLLGIPPGEFGLDSCAIGYAKQAPPPTPRPAFDEAVRWLD
jgi:nitroreductase